jgi:hypothetical protein
MAVLGFYIFDVSALRVGVRGRPSESRVEFASRSSTLSKIHWKIIIFFELHRRSRMRLVEIGLKVTCETNAPIYI